MILSRIDDPAPLVALPALKAHLRVEGDDDDMLIRGLLAAALAHLDGPRGVLGRCLMPQQWKVEPTWSGSVHDLRLPVPGVKEVLATVAAGDDEPMAVTPRIRRSGPWTYVSVPADAGQTVSITLRAETPADALDAVRMAVLLLVGHWYENREAVVTGTIATTLPLSVDRLLSPLKVRWV